MTRPLSDALAPQRRADHSVGNLADQLAQIGSSQQLNTFLIAHFPRLGRRCLLENVIATNWSADRQRRYALQADALAAALKTTTLPLLVSESSAPCYGHLSGSVYELRKCTTLALAPYDAGGKRFLILFSGDDPPPTESLPSLVYQTIAALDGYAQSNPGPHHGLNSREISCLEWAAAGKSSAEISVILSLSEHTINGYMKSAVSKLGCVTRGQAIAVACKLNLV